MSDRRAPNGRLGAILGALIAGCILAGRSLLSGDVKITAGCTVDRVAGIREWARASNHSNHPVDYTTVFTVVDGSGRPVLSEGGEHAPWYWSSRLIDYLHFYDSALHPERRM